MSTQLAAIVIVCMTIPACAMNAQPSSDWLRHRASTDLRCHDVRIHDTQDTERKRAQGCSRETSYARICEDGHCRWVQERPVEPVGPPPK